MQLPFERDELEQEHSRYDRCAGIHHGTKRETEIRIGNVADAVALLTAPRGGEAYYLGLEKTHPYFLWRIYSRRNIPQWTRTCSNHCKYIMSSWYIKYIKKMRRIQTRCRKTASDDTQNIMSSRYVTYIIKKMRRMYTHAAEKPGVMTRKRVVDYH